MHPARHRHLALLVAATLLAAGLPGGAPAVRAATTGVTIDLSLGNGIASGAVVDPDPAHALVTATNGYHFWAGLDLQAPTGAAQLAPTTLAVDARGIYGTLGLIGPGATSAWSGTFGAGGGSQAVWIHYDLATPRGAQALALTCLTIVADTFGSPLLAPSAAVVQHAVTLITDLAPFTDLLAAVQRNDPWAIAKQWSLLLQSGPGRAAIIEALAELGVIATDTGVKALGSVVGLIDFAQTMVDLLRAGIGGHTSGQVTFAVAAASGVTASAPAPPSTPSLVKSPTYRGVFVPTGVMSTARSALTATVLADGRVLVVGGWDASSAVASAEIYDPATRTFTPTGSMSTARRDAAAVLLADGRVLVIGGYATGWVPLSSAEVFDPKIGAFARTGNMKAPRGYPAASILGDGRVLVLGGYDAATVAVASAELYDPRTGAFTRTGSMSAARVTKATLLADGRVLVAGGLGAEGVDIATAELYDPDSGTFAPTGSMSIPRAWQSVTRLSDGRVLVAGGSNASGATFSSAELFDPHTGTFDTIGSMAAPRAWQGATLLPNGEVLVEGGFNATSEVTAELFDPRTGTFTPTGSMSWPRGYHSACLLPNGEVLVVGTSAPAELFQ
jgi:hypothetical protein